MLILSKKLNSFEFWNFYGIVLLAVAVITFLFFAQPDGAVIKFILGAISTFLGAYFAFQFNRESLKSQEVNENVRSIRSILFALARIANDLTLYHKDCIQPNQNKSMLQRVIRQLQMIDDLALVNLDVSNVTVLVEQDPNTALQIDGVKNKYDRICSQIHYGQLLNHEIQIALEKSGLTEDLATELEVKNMIGVRLFSHGRDVINNLDYNVLDAIEMTNDAIAALYQFAKKEYPGRIFINGVQAK